MFLAVDTRWWNCSTSISEGVVSTCVACLSRAESVWAWQLLRDWCRAETTFLAAVWV